MKLKYRLSLLAFLLVLAAALACVPPPDIEISTLTPLTPLASDTSSAENTAGAVTSTPELSFSPTGVTARPTENATVIAPLPSPTRICGQAETAPAPGVEVWYTVQAGDSLSGIACRFGVSVDSLMILNPGIEDRNLIFSEKMRIR